MDAYKSWREKTKQNRTNVVTEELVTEGEYKSISSRHWTKWCCHSLWTCVGAMSVWWSGPLGHIAGERIREKNKIVPESIMLDTYQYESLNENRLFLVSYQYVYCSNSFIYKARDHYMDSGCKRNIWIYLKPLQEH